MHPSGRRAFRHAPPPLIYTKGGQQKKPYNFTPPPVEATLLPLCTGKLISVGACVTGLRAMGSPAAEQSSSGCEGSVRYVLAPPSCAGQSLILSQGLGWEQPGSRARLVSAANCSEVGTGGMRVGYKEEAGNIRRFESRGGNTTFHPGAPRPTGLREGRPVQRHVELRHRRDHYRATLRVASKAARECADQGGGTALYPSPEWGRTLPGCLCCYREEADGCSEGHKTPKLKDRETWN